VGAEFLHEHLAEASTDLLGEPSYRGRDRLIVWQGSELLEGAR
jgi:hypothetical protein